MLEIQQLLQSFELPQSREQQQFEQILASWTACVGDAIAAQARPLLVQRNVLQVAVSSPVWTQTLVFERPKILQKLNDRLAVPLEEIRFSTVQWHQQPLLDISADTTTVWTNHPCRCSDTTPAKGNGGAAASSQASQLCLTPETAFAQWLTRIQQRSQHLPMCPQCQCPTPSGELERWGVCSLCSAQKQ